MHLRNSDLNKIHILLMELAKPELQPQCAKLLQPICARQSIATAQHGPKQRTNSMRNWRHLKQAIEVRKKKLPQSSRRSGLPSKSQQVNDKAGRRLADELQTWEREDTSYCVYRLACVLCLR